MTLENDLIAIRETITAFRKQKEHTARTYSREIELYEEKEADILSKIAETTAIGDSEDNQGVL